MHGLGFNRFAARYLSGVKSGGGVIPFVTTPWVVNRFAADWYYIFGGQVACCYPFIGGTADSHAVDLFGKFPITWVGTVTHQAGAGGGSRGGAGSHGEIAKCNDVIPNINSCSFGVYCGSNTAANEGEMGVESNSNTSVGFITRWGNTGCYAAVGNTSNTSWPAGFGNVGTNPSSGMWWVRRWGATTADIYRNGVGVTSCAVPAAGTTTNKMGVCGWSNSYMSTRMISFAFVSRTWGNPITSQPIIYAFMKHLGRNLDPPN